MAKIRHIAIAVPDPERTAEFYVKSFGMERAGYTDTPIATGVYLTDGTVNLAILNYKMDKAVGKPEGTRYVGAHHFGFVVEDLDASRKEIESNGGKFFLDLPDQKDTLYYEMKFTDPNGIVFDISHHGWVGTK
ncbi:MAG: VOC family protein [Alphaproteobacteria bacterium]|nr:VOC family protein [Alphaproteobacteria bacterium]